MTFLVYTSDWKFRAWIGHLELAMSGIQTSVTVTGPSGHPNFVRRCQDISCDSYIQERGQPVPRRIQSLMKRISSVD